MRDKAALIRQIENQKRQFFRLSQKLKKANIDKAALKDDNHKLRIMLCLSSSTMPYTDDGELQDNSVNPCIDYLRDSPDEIRNKKAERLYVLAAKHREDK